MKFEYPEIQVVTFAVEDIITVSSDASSDFGGSGKPQW